MTTCRCDVAPQSTRLIPAFALWRLPPSLMGTVPAPLPPPSVDQWVRWAGLKTGFKGSLGSPEWLTLRFLAKSHSVI